MSEDKRPGWLLRKMFGTKEEERPAPVPVQPPDPKPAPKSVVEPVVEPAALPVDSPASLSEGQPDFATAATDVSHVPPPPGEPGEGTPDKNAIPDELEGADLQPVEGAKERPPAGTAGDDPARGAEPADTTSQAFAPEPAQAVPRAPLPEPEPEPEVSTQIFMPEPDGASEEPKRGWWSRLTGGMKRTSSALTERVTGLFTKRKLDADTLEELEDALIQADFGIETATRISEAVGKGRYEKGISPDAVREILAAEVERALTPVAIPFRIDASKKPFVILMIGVNGAGKTTTIGKLALKLKAEGHSLMLAAGDTFRAAAIEQLKVWGQRTQTPVIARAQGADAAGLAFDAYEAAKAQGTDVLLIDTAGRLQNKAGLMAELEKILRVIRKIDPQAPHAVLLVLDATVGQNALSQVELFSKAANVTGLVMTKLDGTARGGILVALAAKFGLPVHFIGVGEGVEDLEPFAARDFARAIAGLDAG
ncbi:MULTISPECIES: signal recognition particle-docking protein FtsY [unclassified Methylobacterium]|uniref:signal recognition particle-docking protein FtsY n=1 Tax=unclassified Methylobacterium TaxID=2615210 RepID=UPI0006F2BF39|nr:MULTISPECIES: signal recognition particle-docking protein FtsY [unclassified Methylobacterium]KQO78248.1 signal recognition particle-docking protein FtsY [Methylobacterium sp. Leaf88]KQP73208.1 signal recognition particle-docking protein FtsY [Methylobacterium sp. Leaf111]KQU18998.1 signal recognition particle-docking protein FtsY [Methylobacterium sp. Leaf94]